jgi:hypothetical protein
LNQKNNIHKEACLLPEQPFLIKPEAHATIVAKVLPVFFPELVFYEEGCYKLVHDTIPIIVSPDGSCRNANDKPTIAVFRIENQTSVLCFTNL